MRTRHGQMMVEIIIALGVFSLIASALTTLVFSSSSGFWVGENEAQAATLLRDSLEEIREIKMGAWNELVSGTTTAIYRDGQWDIVTTTPPADVISRTVSITDVCRQNGVHVSCDTGVLDVYAKQVDVTLSLPTRIGTVRQMRTAMTLTNWESKDWIQTIWSAGSGIGLWGGQNGYAYDDGGIEVQSNGRVQLAPASAACQGNVWDFTIPTDYIFDTQQMQVRNGSATRVTVSPFMESQSWDFNVASEYVTSVGAFVDGTATIGSGVGGSVRSIAESRTWNFNTASEYVLSDGAIVREGNGALKPVSGDENTVGLYHFDESSGTILDSSGKGNNLTVFGTPTRGGAGVFSSSTLFDSTGGDYGAIVDANQTGLDGMSRLTIDTWIQRSSTSSDGIIARKWNTATGKSYLLLVTKTGMVTFYISTDGAGYRVVSTPVNVVPFNTWTHLAATYDGSFLRIYINGQLRVTPVSATGAIFNGGDQFQVSTSGSSALNGFIDELRVSTIVRWSSPFTPPTAPYGGGVAAGDQTIVPARGIVLPAVQQWTGVTVGSTLTGAGALRMQLSDDNGVTWKYWNGTSWVVASTLGMSNTTEEVSDSITSFPTSTGRLLPRFILNANNTDTGRVQIDTATISYQVPSLDSATVALWHFDETTGNFLDSSGNNNHLTPLGTPTRSQVGVFGSAVLFDTAGNDYARILDTAQTGLDGMSELTIDLRYRRTATTTSDAVLVRKWSVTGSGPSYSLQVTSLGAVRFYLSSNGTSTKLLTTPNGVVPFNQWAHIAAVYDGAFMRVFVNGVLQGSPVAMSGAVFNGAGGVQISTTGASASNGIIDEVRISNVARWVDQAFVPTVPYGAMASGVQVVTPKTGIDVPAVERWESFSVTSTLSGDATVLFQLSPDNGNNWFYWNGASWVVTSSTANGNTAQEVSQYISSFSATTGKLLPRLLLESGDEGMVRVDSMVVGYAIPSLDSATVGLWQFNEESGLFLDSSGNNNNLTLFGTPTRKQPGVFDSSVLFDLSGNDYARILDTAQTGLEGMSELTVEAWVQRTATSTGDAIIARKWVTTAGRSYTLQITPQGALRFYLITTNGPTVVTNVVSLPNLIPIGAWTHIAATYDGAFVRLFVNGTLVGTPAARTGSVPNTADQFQISSTGSSVANARIDEVRVSSKARWKTSFTPYSVPYGSTGAITSGKSSIRPAAALTTTAVDQWHGFVEVGQKNGGSITYQLSETNGASWRYWNGSAWVPATTDTQTNTAEEISQTLWLFPVDAKQITFRAFLEGNATLDSVEITCATKQMETAVTQVRSNEDLDITFANTYTRPVVVLSSDVSSWSLPVVESVSSTGARVSFVSPDGESSEQSVSLKYMVVEEGVWDINGLSLEARRIPLALTPTSTPSLIVFRQSFSGAPIVFAQRLSQNSAGFVGPTVQGESENQTPNTNGFRLGLSGFGALTSHPTELVGWVALSANTSAQIRASEIRTGSVVATQSCGTFTLADSLDESPFVFAQPQIGLRGVATDCGEQTTSTVRVALQADGDGLSAPTGYVAVSQPFRYTQATGRRAGFVGRGSFTSSVFALGDASPIQILDVDATVPACGPSCRITAYIRKGVEQNGGVTWSEWYGPITSTEPALLPSILNDAQMVQYRVELFGNGTQTPTLESVRINYK